MDQHKTNLPHFKVPGKNDCSMTVKLVGVLIHRPENREEAHAFFIDKRFSSDSNLYIEILRRIFAGIGWRSLPRELMIQMDNTASTNKNALSLLLVFLML